MAELRAARGVQNDRVPRLEGQSVRVEVVNFAAGAKAHIDYAGLLHRLFGGRSRFRNLRNRGQLPPGGRAKAAIKAGPVRGGVQSGHIFMIHGVLLKNIYSIIAAVRTGRRKWLRC